MNRIEVTDLVIRYGSGSAGLVAVDGVDLEVPAGGTLGLVGESGCGKSTLARALVGLLPIVSGQIQLNGVDCTRSRARDSAAYRRQVQMIFQDPYASLNPRMTIGSAIGEAISLRGITQRNERRAVALKALDMVGLGETALARYPHQFSGGQRQRIAIARALAVGPQVIITDEVTSSLDVSVQATILNLLKDVQRETGVSFLFISHDLSVVSFMSDRVAVMYLGQVVETAPVQELFDRPKHPYTAALINGMPRLRQPRVSATLSGDLPDPRTPPRGCRFHTRCPVGPARLPERSICVEQDPQLTRSEREHHAACHFADRAQSGSRPAEVRL